MTYPLPQFLPGKLVLEPGTARDYTALEQFHYIASRPATWAAVWTIRYTPHCGYRAHPAPSHDPDTRAPAPQMSRPVAVGVLSYPVPSCRPRERILGTGSLTRLQKLAFVNQQVRTISRIIVHPQFRSLGLSSILVRCLCDHCDTRYVEAIAMMARAHPFFERAGMTRIEPDAPDQPVYFILDRPERPDLEMAA
jgi:hypothetical protein